MNAYLILILLFLIGADLLHRIARRLNERALSPELPAEFTGILDSEKYRKSQDYARANMRFSDKAEAVQLALVLGFILLGGFNWADLTARQAGFGPIVTGLLFFAILWGLSELVGIPFSLWRTFVIEERFGFNRTSPATFMADRLKGWLLTALIGGPILALAILFFRTAGDAAWLWCWAAVTAITLGVTYIAPVWILPLFNTFTPLEDGPLRSRLEGYAESQGFTISGLFVIDGSRRSSKANAYFTGLGSKKRIALFDTLLEQLSDEELEGVLAHEVGHNKLGHVRKRLILSVLNTGLVFFLLSLFLNSRPLFDAFGMEHMSVHAGLVFFALLYTPVSLLLGLGLNALSRRHEYEADAFAARTTGRPEALASGLKKLSAGNLSNLTPHWLTVVLDYSHPPVVERIRALEALNAPDAPQAKQP